MTKKYSGIVVPMVTPITEEGEIDFISVEKICLRFVECGVSPFLLGTTGESPSLTIKNSHSLIRKAVETVKGKVDIYVGISGNCVAQNIENARVYEDLGVDVLVSNLPSYYHLSSFQMKKYFERLAESVFIPVIMYNIPSTTNMSIPLETVKDLSEHYNIVGFKDSERDEKRMVKCVEMFRDREDFSYFLGYAALSSKALKLGADGLVPSTANFTPNLFKKLYDYSVSRQWDDAERIQRETDEIAKIYQNGRTLGESLQALKVMLSVLELCQPIAIPPLTNLPFEEQKKIVEATKSIIEKYQI